MSQTDDKIVVLKIKDPADFVEKLTGHRPRSGVCILCGNALTTADIDHSVCNPCWDNTFKHKFEPYKNGCDLCDEPFDAPIHIKEET